MQGECLSWETANVFSWWNLWWQMFVKTWMQFKSIDYIYLCVCVSEAVCGG